MSESFVLDPILYAPSLTDLSRALHIRDGSPRQKDLILLIRQAEAIARPKAMYQVAYINENQNDRVVIGGIGFSSRVLSVNLASLHRVFPYVVTSGLELNAWAHSFEDVLLRFYADAIQESALIEARNVLRKRLAQLYLIEAPGGDGGQPQLSDMNPGSLPDWPIQEQKALFKLVGDVQGGIGVTLTESYLMVPTKSISGIAFPSEDRYANCQLCPREGCPGRKAPYDATLYDRKYA